MHLISLDAVANLLPVMGMLLPTTYISTIFFMGFLRLICHGESPLQSNGRCLSNEFGDMEDSTSLFRNTSCLANKHLLCIYSPLLSNASQLPF